MTPNVREALRRNLLAIIALRAKVKNISQMEALKEIEKEFDQKIASRNQQSQPSQK